MDEPRGWFFERIVDGISIDTMTERYGAPDNLFIDVEGFECQALEGATATLETNPDVFLEVHVGEGLEKLGGYQTPIHLFLHDRFESVTVIDPLIKAKKEQHPSGGVIRHVRGLLHEYAPPSPPDGLIFLGCPPQVLGDADNRSVLADWIERTKVSIIEFPTELYDLRMGFVEMISGRDFVVDTCANFDFSANRLPPTKSPYKPYLKRSLFVLRPASAAQEHEGPNTDHSADVIRGEISLADKLKYQWFPGPYNVYARLRNAGRG